MKEFFPRQHRFASGTGRNWPLYKYFNNLTLNYRKAIMANGGPKTRETWSLHENWLWDWLIQRPEDGINPLAEAPKNSEHPCQVYLTNKTLCIVMFIRNACFLWDAENSFPFFISEESLHFNVGDPAYHQTHKQSTKLSTNDTRLMPSSIKHLHKSFLFSSVTHVMSDVTWAWLRVKMSKSWFK